MNTQKGDPTGRYAVRRRQPLPHNRMKGRTRKPDIERPECGHCPHPPLLPTRDLPQTAAPSIDRVRRFFALKNLILQ